MNTREILAVLAAAAAMFAWAALSHMTLGWHGIDLHGVKDPAAAKAVVGALGAERHGIYLSPAPDAKASQEEMNRVMRDSAAGPWVLAVVRPGPNEGGMVRPLIRSFLLKLLAATCLFGLIRMARSERYAVRVGLCAWAGAAAAGLTTLELWNWFEFPTGYSVVNAVDCVVTAVVGGAVLATMLRPQSSPANEI